MNSKGYYEQKGKDPLERSSIYTLSRNDFFERLGSDPILGAMVDQ